MFETKDKICISKHVSMLLCCENVFICLVQEDSDSVSNELQAPSHLDEAKAAEIAPETQADDNGKLSHLLSFWLLFLVTLSVKFSFVFNFIQYFSCWCCCV